LCEIEKRKEEEEKKEKEKEAKQAQRGRSNDPLVIRTLQKELFLQVCVQLRFATVCIYIYKNGCLCVYVACFQIHKENNSCQKHWI
jgi:hypothetical protein